MNIPREVATKKYQVRLTVPTSMWAIVEVEATCKAYAIKQAFEQNKAGNVSYEYSGYLNEDVELSDVEELS
jgi:hypothetical protein